MDSIRKTCLIIVALMGGILCSCADTSEQHNIIGDISFGNYPRVDGSTSTKPLNAMVACKLLNIRCEWISNIVGEWSLQPNQEDIPAAYSNFFDERIKVSQTHGAFVNLIDGNADIILTHRTISPDEKAHADELGVSLIETPIAIDAFVFLVNKNNPVKSLTVEQIQKIYTGEITNWNQVGGSDAAMKVYTRPRNSGSEEVMREIVMGDLEMADFPESSEIPTMAGVFYEVRNNPNAFSYTFNFYKDVMMQISNDIVPKIAVNGVFPSESTVKNGTYPFISKMHVAVRSDLDRNSMAYKLYEWLQTEAANNAIIESGYIPKNTATSISKINANEIRIFPNPVKNNLYVRSDFSNRKINIYNSSGQRVLSAVHAMQGIDVSALPAGVYILRCDGTVQRFLKQ
jgi:phosphate transport system substrate-binding protein